jgi:hypothetical protein
MQFMKYGFLLVLGIATQACGDDSDDGGGGGNDDTGGSSNGGSSNGGSSNGGSSNGGSSNGGSSNGGSSNGGSSNGGSSNGGSSSGGSSTGGTGTGGSGGGCMAGQTNLFESDECADFWACVYETACADAGAQQQLCIETLKQLFTTMYPACVANADVATACDMVKADASIGAQYPECVD